MEGTGTGIMEELRTLLASGSTTRELIDGGYAPGSVYKAQRQVRRQEARHATAHRALAARTITTVNHETLGEMSAPKEIIVRDPELATGLASLETRLVEAEHLAGRVEQVCGKVEHLWTERDRPVQRISDLAQEFRSALGARDREIERLAQLVGNLEDVLATAVAYIFAVEEVAEIQANPGRLRLADLFVKPQQRKRLEESLRAYLRQRPAHCSFARTNSR